MNIGRRIWAIAEGYIPSQSVSNYPLSPSPGLQIELATAAINSEPFTCIRVGHSALTNRR
jgi:hypothetical protein